MRSADALETRPSSSLHTPPRHDAPSSLFPRLSIEQIRFSRKSRNNNNSKEGRKEGRKEVWGSSFSLCRSLETNPPNHHELPYDGGGGAATATAAVKSCTHGAKATFCLPSHLISGGSLLLPYRLKERVSELLQPTTAPLPQKTRRVELWMLKQACSGFRELDYRADGVDGPKEMERS